MSLSALVDGCINNILLTTVAIRRQQNVIDAAVNKCRK